MLITEKIISKEQIRELVLKHGLTMSNLIDEVIEINGIIGVGLISLGEDTKNYIQDKCKNNG